MRLPDPLRNRLRASIVRTRGFHGNIDGVFNDALMGWVHVPGAPGSVQVGLYVKGALLVRGHANIHRGDVMAMGLGDGTAGFALPLSGETLAMIEANGGQAEVRVIGPRPHRLGRWSFGDGQGAEAGAAALKAGQSALQKRLYGDLQLLSGLLARPVPPPRDPRPCSEATVRLFSAQNYLAPEKPLPAPMFAYAEYVRSRNRVDDQFDPHSRPDDVAHFFKFYLAAYAPMRRNLRVPLSAEAIAWLNERVVIGGQPRHLSRAAWSFILEVPPLMQSMDFNNYDWYVWVLYWWSENHVRAIGCEDCLVPEYFAETLRGVPPARRGLDWAPSEYMLRMHSETPELSDLPLGSAAGRRHLACALMVMALSRPDMLRYIPDEVIEAALAPPDPETARGPLGRISGWRGRAPSEGAPTVLAQFCAALGQPMPGLTRAAYAGALRHQGFDLDGRRFASFTAEGHRAEFARLPALPDGPPVDIQVIGPVKKASGLGQATRLSISALNATVVRDQGLTLNTVDYSLDNPAPEGFNSERDVSDYRRARVNLFHINAESLPLSVAYQPDVMAGAYNIGYFFWELDGPAACHYLALDLLDEIWVSTDYGVAIYQPHTDKPVINVGMSYEALPEIPRDAARGFLEETAKVKPDDFVFMVTFDSFSFVQRKNPLGVIAAFDRAFRGVEGVRLVIKTQNRTKVGDPVQKRVWEAVDAALAADERLVLIDETLHYADLLKLKKGADAYISLHRSEGWGFGMIEAMNLGVPVVCTAYSGNMDFCSEETCWLVDYDLVEPAPQDYIFVRPGQKWAEPDVEDAARQMRALFADPEDRAARAAAALKRVQTEFSEAAIGARYAARMREIFEIVGSEEMRHEA